MKQLIEVLKISRNKLVDLSNRNKLIKYTLDPRRPRHIDIVHSSLEEVWKLIGSGNPLKIQFFPEAEEVAVADSSKKTLSLKEIAKKYGINPSLELPIEAVESNGNNTLQTLLPFEQFRRLIAMLSDNARVANEEKGVNTLYCALGFLEWKESKTSDLLMTSPLLLAPVELERNSSQITSGGSALRGGGSEHEDWVVNPSLKLKLKNDFDIELPEWKADDTPASFFKSLEAIISVYPEWSILARVLISNFAFPKLALYEDLDLQHWEEEDGNSLLKHPVINQLLIGLEREASSEERKNIDDDFVAASVEGVVFNADSSQLKAIQRVVNGESLVLEGPPGTGKSQTIANLICVAMAQGKKVLFVADKKAAIEVVQQRLDKVGLDSFCLNLHDCGRSAKQAMYDSLKKRLEFAVEEKGLTQDINGSFYKLRDGVSNTAKSLNEYYAQLAHHQTKESSSVVDVLWSSLKTRKLYNDLPASVKRIDVPDALSLSEGQCEEIRRHLTDLEAIDESLGLSKGGLRQHDLFGFCFRTIDYFKQQQLGELAENLRKLTANLTEHRIALHDLGLFSEDTISGCELWSQLYSAMGDRGDHPLLYSLVGQLENSSLRECVYDIVRLCPQLNSIALDVDKLSELITVSSRLVNYIETSHSNVVSLDCLSDSLLKEMKSTDHFVQSFRMMNKLIQENCPGLVDEESLDWSFLFRGLAEILRLLVDEDSSAFNYLNRALYEGEGDNHWSSLWDSAKRAKGLRSELQSVCPVEWLMNSDLVNSLCLELFASNYTRYFHPKWWRARAKLSTISFEMLKYSERKELLGKLQKWHKLDVLVRKDDRLIDLLGEVLDMGTIDFESILRAQEIHKNMHRSNPEIWSKLQENCENGLAILTKTRELFENYSIETLLEMATEIEKSFTGGSFEQIESLAKGHLEKTSQLIDGLGQLGTGQEAARERLTAIRVLLENLQSLDEGRGLFARNAVEEVFAAIELLDNITESVPSEIISSFLSKMNHGSEGDTESILAHLRSLKPLVDEFCLCLDRLQKLGMIYEDSLLGKMAKSNPLDSIQERLSFFERSLNDLSSWASFQQILGTIEENMTPVWPLIKQCIDEDRSLSNIVMTFETLLSQSCAKEVLNLYRNVLGKGGNEIQRVKDRFVREELQYREMSLSFVKKALLERCVPKGSRSYARRGEWTGLELINHELGKKNRRVSPRNLIGRAAASLLELTPCFMMSPLTVAQYLSPESKIKFDLVLIDEASQLRPEEAFSAIARGTQLVIVGDSKQLPPTNFFGDVSENEDVPDEDAIDNESILDMASVTFPSQSLLWHYRSRHDSLIYFSNRHFYDERLVICPSPLPISKLAGVHLVQVNGLYKAHLNHMEADAIVAKAVELIRGHPRMSMGIVAINRSQQEYINNLLYEMRCNDSEVDKYLEFWEQQTERCFVKNLENVQGDERDVILISTVYGPQESGAKVLRRFGPINSTTGHRRLNVLCTRARDCMYVFTSLKPTDICPPDVADVSVGAKAFSAFLEFAASGIQSTREGKGNSLSESGDPDSPFEEYVGDLLTRSGYFIDYQVGQSGFRIDIGVRHSTYPYGYIAGIECDGALYHSHKTARDRDRLRQDILEEHGWNIYRIWSTDWFNCPQKEGDKLLNWLEKRLTQLAESLKPILEQKSELVLQMDGATLS